VITIGYESKEAQKPERIRLELGEIGHLNEYGTSLFGE
jgi:hypothetical protein